jgi:hypothetical protein
LLSDEKGIVAYHEGIHAQAGEACERSIDFGFSAGVQDFELHPLGARGRLHVSDHRLAIPIGRVDEQAERPSLRNQLGKQFQPLGYRRLSIRDF